MREVMVRMPKSMIARADAYARAFAIQTGITMSRSDVCRMALMRLLDAEAPEVEGEVEAKPNPFA